MDVSFCGESMLPSIKEGDKVLIELFTEPRSINDVDVGEIVVFKDGDEWISHRVIQFKNKKYTKGDWSYCIDPKLPLWGKVVAVNGSEKKLNYSQLLALLSALDLKHSLRVLRWSRKLVSIFINRLANINF